MRLGGWIAVPLIAFLAACQMPLPGVTTGYRDEMDPVEEERMTPMPGRTASPAPEPAEAATAAPFPPPTESALRISLTIVYDNNAYDERLGTAWGFACLIEGAGATILFDTGGDGALLLRNLRALDIDPAVVDAIVISHAHTDHTGGLASFLAENRALSVYVLKSFPEQVKRAVSEAGAELVEVTGPTEIVAGVQSTGPLGKGIEEQSLVIETVQGVVVITGCAHPGIVSIVRHVQELTDEPIYLVLGGFHLGGASRAAIADIVDELRALGVLRVAPVHCSGDVARTVFEEGFGEDYIAAGVGGCLDIGP